MLNQKMFNLNFYTMKKTMLPLLFLALVPKAIAQCTDPVALPYIENVESATLPEVPGCLSTTWDSFASYEQFESLGGPIPGFEGNVLAYDTAVNTEWGTPPDSWVSARLTTPMFEMTEGTTYRLSFRYANSNAGLTIDQMNVYLREISGPHVELDIIENITGGAVTDYVVEFTPPATGIYSIDLTVATQGSQGLLYLDDILVEATPIIDNQERLSSATFYPNPAKDMLNIHNTTIVDSFEIYSTSGQLMLSGEPGSESANIDLASLPSGIYLAHIKSGSQVQVSRIARQ